MAFWHMRGDEIRDRVEGGAAGQRNCDSAKGAELSESICHVLSGAPNLRGGTLPVIVAQMLRCFLIFIVCLLLAGCASDDPLSTSMENHPPVAGESTPPPATGTRGGWAW